MRVMEIAIALIAGFAAFFTVNLIGVALQVALIAAIIGLVTGFIIARAFRGTLEPSSRGGHGSTHGQLNGLG